jgi:uncharacterized delta-60 repeat protein
MTNIQDSDTARAVAIQPDGKIVVAGDSIDWDTVAKSGWDTGAQEFELARYNPDGSLDTTFGTQGTVLTALGLGADVGALTIGPDGSILVGGQSSLDFTVLRYRANGALDASFGTGGKVMLDLAPEDQNAVFIGERDSASGLVVQPDGKIVAIGTVSSASAQYVLLRFTPSGTLDPEFNGTGEVSDEFLKGDNGVGISWGTSLALQPDGRIVIAGWYAPSGSYVVTFGEARKNTGLARYNADGSLDTSFGGTGKILADSSPYSNSGPAVALRADGTIVVAGSGTSQQGAGLNLAGYDSQGRPVFNTTSTDRNTSFFDLAFDPDGRIVIEQEQINSITLARYTTDLPGSVSPLPITIPPLPFPIYTATGSPAGAAPQVTVIGGFAGTPVFQLQPYDPHFTGGVRVAVGDVNGNGTPDIVTGAGPGGGPDIHVYDGITGKIIRQFFAFDPAFTGGVTLAVADVNHDGYGDVIVGADAGGGPSITVFDGKSLVTTGQLIKKLAAFFAFDPHFTGGVRVAGGDVNGDGYSDIIVGAGAGGGPNVIVFDGKAAAMDQLKVLDNFFAFDPHFTGGVEVTAADVNYDGKSDLVISAGPGGGPNVRIFDGSALTQGAVDLLANFFAYAADFGGGVQVAVVPEANKDQPLLLAVPASGGDGKVSALDAFSGASLDDAFTWASHLSGGSIAAGDDV